MPQIGIDYDVEDKAKMAQDMLQMNQIDTNRVLNQVRKPKQKSALELFNEFKHQNVDVFRGVFQYLNFYDLNKIPKNFLNLSLPRDTN